MRPRSLLAPLSNADLADLLAPMPNPRCLPTFEILLQRCPVCEHWLPQGSLALGQCLACEAWFEPLRMITPTITRSHR